MLGHRPLVAGAWLTLINMLHLTISCRIWSFKVKWYESVRRSAWKIDPIASRLSRSLKVIGNGHGSIRHLWLPKGKGKGKYTWYSASSWNSTSEALRYGSYSVTCKLHRTCLYLVSIHQMAHPRLRLRTSNCSLLLIYLPRKDECYVMRQLVYLPEGSHPSQYKPGSM